MTDPRSDQELIAAANAGDPDAFQALYCRHRDWVVRLAYRFTGDHDQALDVAQETFLYFLRKFPGFTLTANLKTFLYPAVRHLAIASRQKTHRYASDEEALENLPTAADPQAQAARHAELAEVVSVLPPGQRETLLLRFVDGLSLQEIAEALDVPLGTVKSRLHNAVETLRHDERTRRYFLQ